MKVLNTKSTVKEKEMVLQCTKLHPILDIGDWIHHFAKLGFRLWWLKCSKGRGILYRSTDSDDRRHLKEYLVPLPQGSQEI